MYMLPTVLVYLLNPMILFPMNIPSLSAQGIHSTDKLLVRKFT